LDESALESESRNLKLDFASYKRLVQSAFSNLGFATQDLSNFKIVPFSSLLIQGSLGRFEILIVPNVGSLDGVTEAGAQVVLIPTRNRERTELFRPVTADTAAISAFRT
jgi:hypothetical protein